MFSDVPHWLRTAKDTLREVIPKIDVVERDVAEWVSRNKDLISAAERSGDAVSFTEDDMWALGLYTYDLQEQSDHPERENFFAAFNRFLREYRLDVEATDMNAHRLLASWLPYMHYLRTAIEKLPEYNGRVWRGIEDEGLCPLKQNMTYRFCGFTSSSISR